MRLKRLLDVLEPVVLVDMRKPAEYKAGHLPGAISLPVIDLERRYREIPRGPRVVLYCACPLEEMGSVHAFLASLGWKKPCRARGRLRRLVPEPVPHREVAAPLTCELRRGRA
jgi:hypothetical protein